MGCFFGFDFLHYAHFPSPVNLMHATGFHGAELWTYEFSIFQVGVFYQAYQILKANQGFLILEKIIIKITTYVRAHQYRCQQRRLQH